MNEALVRIAALEAKLGALIQSQETLTRHIDNTLKSIQVISEERLKTLVAHDEFDKLVPIGAIIPFGGWFNYSDRLLDCDGKLYSRAEYPKLYEAVSNFFGPGRTLGMTNPDFFCVPDLRFRVPVGVGDLKPEEEHPQGADGIEKKNATHTARQLGDRFGSEFAFYEWNDHVRPGGIPYFLGISRAPTKIHGPNDEMIDVRRNSWQPSLAIKFLIRAV